MIGEGEIAARCSCYVIEQIPMKVYVFRDYPNLSLSDLADALAYSARVASESGVSSSHPYALAFPFGFEEDGEPKRGVDIVAPQAAGKVLFGPQADNVIYSSWTMEDGVWRPREEVTTCGVVVRILGKEDELRERVKDLREYFSTWPDIGQLYKGLE